MQRRWLSPSPGVSCCRSRSPPPLNRSAYSSRRWHFWSGLWLYLPPPTSLPTSRRFGSRPVVTRRRWIAATARRLQRSGWPTAISSTRWATCSRAATLSRCSNRRRLALLRMPGLSSRSKTPASAFCRPTWRSKTERWRWCRRTGPPRCTAAFLPSGCGTRVRGNSERFARRRASRPPARKPWPTWPGWWATGPLSMTPWAVSRRPASRPSRCACAGIPPARFSCVT